MKALCLFAVVLEFPVWEVASLVSNALLCHSNILRSMLYHLYRLCMSFSGISIVGKSRTYWLQLVIGKNFCFFLKTVSVLENSLADDDCSL